MTRGGQRVAPLLGLILDAAPFATASAFLIAAALCSPPLTPRSASAAAADTSGQVSAERESASAAVTTPDRDDLESAEDEQAGSPVMLGGRELWRVRASDRARSAEERARSGSERLLRFAREKRPVDPVRIERAHDGMDVHFGTVPFFTVFHVDSIAEGRDLEELARERAATARGAILEYRASRTTRRLIISCIIAVLATIGLILALRVIASLHRRVREAIERWVTAREENIRRRTMAVLRGAHVLLLLQTAVGLLRSALLLVVGYLYIYVVLAAFPWTAPVANNLESLIIGPLRTLGESFLAALPGLIFIAIVGVIVRYALQFLRFLYTEVDAERILIPGFYSEWAKPTYHIARVLVIFFALVICYPYIPGSDTEAFKGVSIFVGVLLSLGSTSAVANLVAGFVLTYMRAFRVGDIVRIGEEQGMATEVTLLATRLRTPKNVIVTIPNATVLGARITNYSTMARTQGLILNTKVTVGYDAPWRQVHALLLQAADRTPGIRKDPAPFVLQTGMEQVQVVYELNAYTDQADRMLRVYSDLHKNIQDAFNEYGVQIMTPFYEGDKEAPLVVPKEKWYAAPARAAGEPGADQ
jgi:small-conductance mechanosensitive channel